KGLLLLEPVEDLLTAALDPEHHSATIGLCHQRIQMLGDRIDPALATPVDGWTAVDQPFADGFDPLGLQQEVIVDKVHRTVAVFLQMIEFREHVLVAAGAPFALVEPRNVAEDAAPRAS